MNRFIKPLLLLLLLISTSVWATQSFVVRKITFEGLQTVSSETALNYLPVKVGETLKPQETTDIIKALFATGFFSNVILQRDGSTLIVVVTERPTISNINITGNKDIPHDKLDDALKKMGLQKGRFFDQATLEQAKQALTNQYFSMGRYNASVETSVTDEDRNRVSLEITISEGSVAKVAGIQIIGNTHFQSDEIIDGLALSTSNLMSFFTRKDEYSDDKLQQSIQALQSYYMDRGYVRMRVTSTQVTITPDRKQVYVLFNISEGDKYYYSGYKLTGDLVGQATELSAAVRFKKGQVFSRQDVLNTSKYMTFILGDQGYAFAKVTPEPDINDQNKTVFINFNVQPDRKYYIRNITFFGNTSTSEIALRNQVYQMEGGLYNATDVQNSINRLRQNQYIDGVEQPPTITPKKVDDQNDLLDLNVNIAEKLAASFNLSFGYSQAFGFLVSTGVTHPNFMGSGKTVGFNLSVGAYQKSLSLYYLDPFYTPDGVSRSISIYGTQTSSEQLALASYNTDNYGVSVSYGFPLSVYSTLSLGYGFQRTNLTAGGTASYTVQNFINNYGTMFNQLLLTAGWSRQTTDLPIMPTKGTIQSLNLTISAPIDNHALQYYKLSYTHDWYQPLNDYFILHTHGIVGYGEGYGFMKGLPFFQNYYAGGVGVQGINRAYMPLSLGPLDSSGNNIGGNLLTSGTVELILPKFTNSVRTSLFLDGGNVFQTNASALGYPYNPFNFNLASLRYSYGAQVEWWTPLNLPLYFSIAQPINNMPNDNLDFFQFTIGTLY